VPAGKNRSPPKRAIRCDAVYSDCRSAIDDDGMIFWRLQFGGCCRCDEPIGAEVSLPENGLAPHCWLFGEDQGRYLVTARMDDVEAILADAEAAGVAALRIGTTGDASLTLTGADTISLAELGAAHDGWLSSYMAGA